MYEKCRGKLAKPVEQPTEGYTSCASSEEDQCVTLRVSGSEHATGDSPVRGDLRFSIHDRQEDSYTSLSPIGAQEISPPTKEELDQQIFARANRNPVSSANLTTLTWRVKVNVLTQKICYNLHAN